MSKHDKLLARFRNAPNGFTYSELKRLLSHYNYKEKQMAGSRVKFVNKNTGHDIKLHKPHPENIIKPFKLREIIEELEKEGII